MRERLVRKKIDSSKVGSRRTKTVLCHISQGRRGVHRTCQDCHILQGIEGDQV